MPLNPVNVGTAANNGTGDPLRLAFQKTNSNDAYLKTYIDNLIQGLKWKQRVDAATTGNVTLSGEQSIDGVTTITSRVLVKDQTDKTENGIYITGAGAWARSADADEGEELVNATVSVVSGTVNANTNWTSNAESITLGTTDIIWVRFQGADGVDQGTFDAAITLINSQLDTKQDTIPYTPANDAEVVKTVTGAGVDNTDPQNPVINIPENGVSDVQDSNGNSLVVGGVAKLPEIGGGASRIPYSFTSTAGQQTFTLPEAFFDLEIQVGNSPLAPTQYTTASPDFTILDELDTGAEVFVWYWKSALPNSESYTKAESEERFAKVRELTQAQYNAMKDAETLEQAFYFTV